MSSALSTKLSVCALSLVESADMIFPLDHFDTFLWPKSGCSDGGGRPGRAVFAVSVAHHCRSPLSFDFNGAAKATGFVCDFAHFFSSEIIAAIDVY